MDDTSNITCVFAEGSTALGCRVFFGSFEVDVDLSPGSTIAVADTVLPETVTGPVRVAEILSDHDVSSITIQAVVTVIFSETIDSSNSYVYK